jgi:RNA polymerase sigma factor (sigma-70 family)
MSDSNWAVLRQSFLASYDMLGKKLTRRFGSADFAADVLHDTYLRLERGGPIGPVSNPESYVLRIAENIGRNVRRRTSRLMTGAETEDIFEHAEDEAPDSTRIIAARQEVALVRTVVADMTLRRRQLFLAVWVEGATIAQLATRFGLSVRLVQKEVQEAREEIATALRKKIDLRGGL